MKGQIINCLNIKLNSYNWILVNRSCGRNDDCCTFLYNFFSVLQFLKYKHFILCKHSSRTMYFADLGGKPQTCYGKTRYRRISKAEKLLTQAFSSAVHVLKNNGSLVHQQSTLQYSCFKMQTHKKKVNLLNLSIVSLPPPIFFFFFNFLISSLFFPNSM